MKRALFLLFLCGIFSCIVILLNGCETTAASDSPEITPSTATIRVGDSVVFRASGGFEYKWSLKDETIGRLNTLRGETVVYRSMYDPAISNSAVQILSVSSIISGTSQTSNTVSYTRTAEARITHIPSSER